MNEGNTNVVRNISVDLPKYLITLFAVISIIIYRFNKIELKWEEIVLIGIAVLPWFSSFTQSFKFGKEGFEAAFREIQKTNEEIKNDVKEVKENSEINQSMNALGTGGKPAIPDSVPGLETAEKAISGNKADMEDPQKGLWGGSPVDQLSHRKLTARIEPIPKNNYLRRVVFRVESTDPVNYEMKDPVIFHLHPTFTKPDVEVIPVENAAELSVVAYGAFTVGAETDQGQTKLELDLAEGSSISVDPFFKR